MTSYSKKANYASPLGTLEVTADENAVTAIRFVARRKSTQPKGLMRRVFCQLDEYFDSNRKSFKFPIHAQGTHFQKRVWKALDKLKYGQVSSYQAIAVSVGGKRYTRAVASAIAKNPVSIAVPCHRVIARNGGLAGYAWGKPRKAWLLRHEEAR